MAKAFLHREQHIRVAACLDVNYAIGVQSRQMQCWGKQVAPAQTPEHWPLDPSKYAGEEDRGAGIIGEIGTAGDFMQRACGQAAARQVAVERLDAEGDGSELGSRPLDLGNAGA